MVEDCNKPEKVVYVLHVPYIPGDENLPDLREYLCDKPSQEVWEGSKGYLDKQMLLEGLCGMDLTENFRVKRLKKLTEFYEEY